MVFAVTWLATILSTSFSSVVLVQDRTRYSFARFRGASEFARHFFGKRHWELDMTYRVQHDLPVFNLLMDAMEISEYQVADLMSRPSKGLAEGFCFPEDLLPACTRVDSSVPLMTLISSVLELFRCGGSYTLLRKLCGVFSSYSGYRRASVQSKVGPCRAETLETLVSYFVLLWLHVCGCSWLS